MNLKSKLMKIIAGLKGLKEEDRCINYAISRNQRENELKKGEFRTEGDGYVDIGCFDCNGYKFKCRYYAKKLD